ncbi:DUF6445 family protein [Qipengyuania gelatinilytica]|uniref:2-oxoglutarate-Fe(II)-dependent oxygenase superfamily protein n=1 Tax=Qipengyuania gelatinilytica TaxID=2867231 RepID=A0ABX9A078_9SPHN|nr:DUF6445 family protein [Qipengyuania gelatinilytica]QZD94497.1 hypothetical protein K3136_10370 [Qipengyuania gelatinilytica]
MQAPDQPEITVHRFGREREPVVVIDNFSGDVDRLLERGRSAEYQAAGASYPGLRAWAEPDFLDRRRDLMFQALQQVFGFRKGVSLEVSTFSLVTRAPEELSPLQRIPHYDHASDELVAIMFYLLGPETGGTAFYRHRRTGFETITDAREPAYDAGLGEDEREYGMPDKAYWYGDGDRYELIGEVEARPDRLVLYRGRLLHSGVIPRPDELTQDPATGRLTINMFLRGR